MILALDTSGQMCAVAVVDAETGELIFAGAGVSPRAHAEELAPLIAEGMTYGAVSQIVVGRGPGSFTGLRVGLVTAQTLGVALDVPVVGVCSLDVVAAQSGIQNGWVVMDARRSEVYLRQYLDGVPAGKARVAPRATAVQLTAGDRVVGDVELLSSDDRKAFGQTGLDPQSLGSVAAHVVAAGSREPATPLYLRAPDVTLSLTSAPAPAQVAVAPEVAATAEVAVRPAQLTDVQAMMTIETEAFGVDTWNRAQLIDELSRVGDTRWYSVLTVGAEVAGYVGLFWSPPDADIQTITISTAWQRKGFGQKLLQAAIQAAWDNDCTRMFLEVRADNEAALALYESAGFVRLGRRSRYYADGVDAINMRLRRHEPPVMGAVEGAS